MGIAVTYWEALEVVRRMVDDLYQKTGEVSAEAFARFTGIDVWQHRTGNLKIIGILLL